MKKNYSYETVFKNSFFNFLGWGVPIIISLISTPYIVKELGKDYYGIWGIVMVIIGYFSFLNLGLNEACVKYISEFKSKNDSGNINLFFNSIVVFYTAMALLGSGIIWTFSDYFAYNVFSIDQKNVEMASNVFKLSSLGFLFIFTKSPFAAIPIALSRFDLNNQINIIFSIIKIAGAVIVLYMGGSLYEFVLFQIIIISLDFFTYIILTKILLKEWSFSLKTDRKVLKKIFNFGIFSTLTKLTYVLVSQTDKFLIGVLMGPVSITFYILPQKVASYFASLSYKLSSIIFPVSSELKAANDTDKLFKIYDRASRLYFGMNLSFYIPIILFSYEILYYWLGSEFAEKGHFVMVFIGLGYLISSLGVIPNFLNLGNANPKLNAIFTGITGITFVGLIYPLAKLFGIVGIAIAFTISHLITPWFILYTHKSLFPGLSTANFLTSVISKNLIIAMINILIVEFITRSLVTSILTLLLMLIVTGLTQIIGMWVFKIISDDEKRFIKRIPLKLFSIKSV